MTLEQREEFYYDKYLHLSQYKKALAANPPTITHETLRAKARAKALQFEANQLQIKNRKVTTQDDDLEDDAEYRQARFDAYEEAFGEWDDAGDKALLINLVELEVQFQAIQRDLTRTTLLGDKEKYWKALRENSEAQKSLQVTLGIDKKTREQTRASGNPMDNWRDIKEELGDWVDMLVEEFIEEAKHMQSEPELKDLMKMKLSWPMTVVDSVVYNLKRVNGMISVREESETASEEPS